MNRFEEIIGYKFNNQRLLVKALSHSSYANECKTDGSNERLEFLGDAVLSIIVSDRIFKNYVNLPEGDLTRIRASLVCEKSLFIFAKQIHLDEYILLGRGEKLNHGNERPSILSDAFEALIAAIYLDGGMEEARRFVLSFVDKEINENHINAFNDYKTTLQEIIQKNPEEKVEYVLVDESGPDHDKKFKVDVRLNQQTIGTGIARSKKMAEQNAAKEALKLMGEE